MEHQFVEEMISVLRCIFKEAMIRSSRDSDIFLLEEHFSSAMQNGDRNPKGLLKQVCVLQRALHGKSLSWNDLFSQAIIVQSNILDYLRKNPLPQQRFFM